MKLLIIIVLVGAASSAPQIIRNKIDSANNGQYIADNSGAYNGDDGQYHPDDSGLYRNDASGLYIGVNTGRTRFPLNHNTINSDSSGRYLHENSGAYINDDGQYHPDGSGAYDSNNRGAYQNSNNRFDVNAGLTRFPLNYNTINRDSNGQYHHENSGAYKNDDGQYHPDGSGAYISKNKGAYQNTYDLNRYNIINAGSSTVTVEPIYTGYSHGVVRDHNVGSYNGRYAIIRQIHDNLQNGYHYLYETENQISGEEEGHLENVGQDEEGITVKGRYSYSGPDNVVYSVEYTADAENGFIASGAHLPKASYKKFHQEN